LHSGEERTCSMLLRVFVDDGFPLFITTQDDNSTTCTYLPVAAKTYPLYLK